MLAAALGELVTTAALLLLLLKEFWLLLLKAAALAAAAAATLWIPGRATGAPLPTRPARPPKKR